MFDKIRVRRWWSRHDDEEGLETYHEGSDLSSVLVGRRVVEVVGIHGPDREDHDGHLLLDDGTVLRIMPNEGCGGCSSGWYSLTELNTVPNVITRVETSVTTEPRERVWSEPDQTYTIFVWAEDQRLPLAEVSGNDGNGYYGTGYTVLVRRAS